MIRICNLLVRLIALGIMAGVASVNAQSVEDENRAAAGFYSRGQWDESVLAFRDMIKRHPKSNEAATGHFFLAEALMQKGEFDEAYTTYQVFVQRLPEHVFVPRATFRMGESAYRAGNYNHAIRLLEIFVKDNPQAALNEFALPYLGEMRLKRSEPQLAQRAYETALRLYPNGSLSNKCRFGLAKAFQMQGAYFEAIRFYQFIVSDSRNPLVGEAELQLAIIYVNQSDFESAEKHLARALPLCTTPETQAEASYWLARARLNNGDFERALQLLQSVAGKPAPEHLASAILFDGAVTATKLDQTDLAREWLTQLVDKFPQSELADDALHLKIELNQRAGGQHNFAETEKWIEQFKELFPGSRLLPGVLETAGRNYYAHQQFEKSIVQFRQLISADKHLDESLAASDRANWLYLQSLGEIALKNHPAAETLLSQIDVTTASEELKPLAQIALATARFGQQKYEYAIPNYRSYLQLVLPDARTKKEVLRARTELTICLAEAGLWAEVVGAFDDLESNHSHEAVVLETASYLADKASRENQSVQALEWYEMLTTVESKPETIARALSGIGWLKLESGDKTGAMLAFDRLVSEFPDNDLTGPAAMARAKALDDENDFARSAQMYGLVIRRFENTEIAKVARLRRAYSLQKIGEPTSLKESRTLLREYLALSGELPAKDEALYQLGWISFDLKLTDESQQCFRDLLAAFPDSKYYADAAFRLAQQDIQQGKLDEADVLLESLLKKGQVPDAIGVRALYLTGEIAAKQARWEVVSNSMRQVLEQSDDQSLNTKANYWLAESLFRQQQFPAAAEIFRSLQASHTGLDPKFEPWIWLRLSQCLGQQSKWSEAAEIADVGKVRFTSFLADYEFDFVRARGREDIGLLTDARQIYQLVVDSPHGGSSETAAIAQWRIGETYFHQENYPEAIKAYYNVDSLFSYEKWRSAAMLQAGKCQEHLGNWDQAQKLYTSLIKQFPDSQYAAASKQRLEKVATLAKLEKETGGETR